MKYFLLITLTLLSISLTSAKSQTYTLKSPNTQIEIIVTVNAQTHYSVLYHGKQILSPSRIDITSSHSSVQTEHAPSLPIKSEKIVQTEHAPSLTKVIKTTRRTIDETISSPFTRQSEMRNHCNALTLQYSNHWDIEFRAYDNGVAYRLIYNDVYRRNTLPLSSNEDSLFITETVEYNTPSNYGIWAPYVSQYNKDKPQVMYATSFENTYTRTTLSELQNDRLMFLPLLLDCGDNIKMCITETHLESYPGLYLKGKDGACSVSTSNSLIGDFAPYPTKLKQGGHNNLQMLVEETAPYKARFSLVQTEHAPSLTNTAPSLTKSLPWRIIMLSDNDISLAENNLSYLLAAPCRFTDISWIKPGKVAWEWWNFWNLEGVDFQTGINNDTYKYYIDFASKHGIEYVILDEGWAVNKQCDLFQVVPEIDLPMLVNYANERNVGIILWAGYWAFDRDMERVCQHYSKMGVKGFKVDFMDRDDQIITDFYYRAAETAAKYHLLLDFHGTSKPAGLNRTYPNVVNFEGVAGLENLKWAPDTWDMPKYDCELPFIRQTAGPMDYTQGAMRNAAKYCYKPIWTEPMSQGTRCHQLGLYVVFESPLCMLCDAPTNYEREEECTSAIASIPTTWDETKVLSGEVGEYIVTARRKGDTWYIGGITNWTKRDLQLDLTPLNIQSASITLFSDGINADKKGTDYRVTHPAYQTKMQIPLAPAGGFLMIITPITH